MSWYSKTTLKKGRDGRGERTQHLTLGVFRARNPVRWEGQGKKKKLVPPHKRKEKEEEYQKNKKKNPATWGAEPPTQEWTNLS